MKMHSYMIYFLLVTELLFENSNAIVVGTNMQDKYIPSLCGRRIHSLPSNLDYLIHQKSTKTQIECINTCFYNLVCTSVFMTKSDRGHYHCALSSVRFECERFSASGEYTYFVVVRINFVCL